ncbi:hypothetical protein QM583_10230 [Gordonia alkanivorans]|uniref:hypothetical protein n=1 Tax=Gordonia alkanivorans TaxID=84096 RepID=UPI0024B849A8|nr:hypothetical protein [Gordonia alkanivorans]MDJ0027469.1 hypothetical protein [Gordonia alkanivorans]
MTTDPTPTLAELEERVRGGDTTITAQDLADAAQADRLASLQQEAAARAQAAEDARNYETAVEQLHKDYAKLQGEDSAAARKAYAEVVAATAKLKAAIESFAEVRTDVRDRASELGVPLQFEDMFRIVGHSPDTYAKFAIREGQGEYLGGRGNPHALHSDEQFTEYEERLQEQFRAEEARRAKELENSETMVELGFNNYARRVDV